MKVHIQRKKIRHAYLRVKDEKSVDLSIPENYDDKMIQSILEDKQTWILEKQKAFKKKQTVHQSFLNRDKIYFLGESYDYEELHTMMQCQSFSSWQKAYDYLLYQKAPTYITELVVELCQKFDLPLPKVQFRKMKRRWGTCYPRQNKIILNRQLIFLPPKAIELVIMHEINHFKYPHHQKSFYDALEKWIPDHKERSQLLSDFALILNASEELR